jgi:serine/threonine protein kinase
MVENGKIDYNSTDFGDISDNGKFILILAKNLLSWMLKFDPAERCTAKEILQHPWITVIN